MIYVNQARTGLNVKIDRMEGVLIMAAKTKALLTMDTNISGAFRTQFRMIIIVSGRVSVSSFSDPLLSSSLLFMVNS